MTALKSELRITEREPDTYVILTLAAIHIVGVYSFFAYASWSNFAVLMVMNFIANCLGITLGYHRLLTHRSFKVPKFWERLFATCGLLALQGPPAKWVGHHRMHHAGSDTEKDPHDACNGFWYSHWGWLFVKQPEFDAPALLNRYCRDINADPYLRFVSQEWVQVLAQILLGVILWATLGFQAMTWGVFVRLVVCYHSTWFVNSASHIWGYQNYPQVQDRSRNLWWVAVLTWGEGWHNNHHMYGDLAPAGHKWWEFDVTMWVIRLLESVGIAYDVKDQIPTGSSLQLQEVNPLETA